ncbi:hypothetical protein GCM10020256_47920 [Streptomyces thermocoprophilus]
MTFTTDLIPAPSAVHGPGRGDGPGGLDGAGGPGGSGGPGGRGGSGGVFVLDERTALWGGPGTGTTERWLRSTLGAALDLPLPPGPEDAPHTVRLRVDDRLRPEGYRLTVSADRGVEIRGGDPAGVFWGAQTLRQLLGPDAFRRAPVRTRPRLAVPELTVEDAPRFRWRGLLLDVARHFMPKDGVLRYLDLMAAHKLNVLHLHLTDDQGWRIEIKRHPKLTETGSWRPRTKLGHRASPLWDERPHGGHYTQDDLREIVAYAAQRHISVVPEIDVPGHSQAAIAAYPELGNTDVVDTAALGVWDTWGVNPNVLAPHRHRAALLRGRLRGSAGAVPRRGATGCRSSRGSSTSAATSAPRTSGVPRPPRRPASRNSGWPARTSCRRGSSAISAAGSPNAGAGSSAGTRSSKAGSRPAPPCRPGADTPAGSPPPAPDTTW